MSTINQSLIKIALITAAHGVRGQVKLRCFTANPEDIFALSPITDEAGKRHFKLTRHGIQKDVLIVSIEGITDRNQAEALKGTAMFAIPKQGKKKENEWFHDELIGLEARLTNGAFYGHVIAVHNFGAGDIIEIEMPGKKIEMLPLQDAFIGEIKAAQGYLVVLPPEYVEAK